MSVSIKFGGRSNLLLWPSETIYPNLIDEMTEMVSLKSFYWWIFAEPTFTHKDYRYFICLKDNSDNPKSLKSVLLDLKDVLKICKSFGFDVFETDLTYWINYRGCSDNGVVEIDTTKSTIKYKGQLGIENIITF